MENGALTSVTNTPAAATGAGHGTPRELVQNQNHMSSETSIDGQADTLAPSEAGDDESNVADAKNQNDGHGAKNEANARGKDDSADSRRPVEDFKHSRPSTCMAVETPMVAIEKMEGDTSDEETAQVTLPPPSPTKARKPGGWRQTCAVTSRRRNVIVKGGASLALILLVGSGLWWLVLWARDREADRCERAVSEAIAAEYASAFHSSGEGTPTSSPSTSAAPTNQFVPGDVTIVDDELDIRMSSGLSVKLIAETGKTTKYATGMESCRRFHGNMDGAGIVPLSDGGWVYVSNSEKSFRNGGVYGLYFDRDGNVVNYKKLLSNTDRNCGGGLSPWNTWISCEEVKKGQCWQVDPDPLGANHETPMETLLGGDGGRYESVACDNRSPDRPVFFTTEDDGSGALRRFEANGNGWDALHSGGKTTFLVILDESNFEWTTNEAAARNSANTFYRYAEGVAYHEGLLYFIAKKTNTLFILNLETMTYESETTGSQFSGKGSFNAQPDQVILGNYKRWIYFTESGGATPGVYVRDASGTYHTIFEAVAGSRRYNSRWGGSDESFDETVGVALSPDRRKLYAGFQVSGLLMEFTRDDGLPFE